MLTFQPEMLNGTMDGGMVQVQVHSTTGGEAIGSWDLDLNFSAFTGNLMPSPPGAVTINSISPLSFGTALTLPPANSVVNDGNSLVFSGFVVGGQPLTTAPIDFFKINFSLAAPLGVGDTFTVGLNPTGQVIGRTGDFQNIYGGMTPQVVGVSAVPEPGTMAFCGLFFAGVAGRQMKKRKKAKAA